MKNFVLLLIVSAGFTWVFQWVGLPAAVLLGAMFGGITLAANGRALQMPKWLFVLAQAVLGAMLARLLTTELFATLSQHLLAFVAVVASVFGLAVLIGVVLTKLGVVPGNAALWGSFPGAASVMVVMSEAYGADSRIVAFMQYLRVLLVTLAATVVARLAFGHVNHAAVPMFGAIDLPSFAVTCVVMVLSAVIAAKARLRAGPMLITMGIFTVLQNHAGLHIELPRWLLVAAWSALGWMIGLRFTRDILRYVGRAFPRVLLGVVVLISLCGVLGMTVARAMHLDLLSAYFATSPGGADAIAVLATNTNVAVSLVMAIQLGRTIVVMLIGPRLAKWLAPRLEPAAPEAARAT